MNKLARKRTAFDTSAMDNNFTYMQYYERLLNIALSVFEWKNVPDTVDTRWLELSLLRDGKAVFFEDEVLGYLALRVAVGGPLNVYNIPINRRAFGNNDYQKQLTSEDSVLIYNNLAHTNNVLDLRMYAQRLYNFDRIIDVNANAQKTPILITCDEPQRLTLKNIYMQYDGNQPVIYGDKGLSPNTEFRVLKTDEPYICDKIQQLKSQYWNEILMFLGIGNVGMSKRERMITSEVNASQGGTIASRFSRLEARRNACKEINNMFGLDLWCDFREDFQMNDFTELAVPGDPLTNGLESSKGEDFWPKKGREYV